MKTFLLFIVCCGMSFGLYGQTGDDFLALSDLEQQAYIEGFVLGIETVLMLIDRSQDDIFKSLVHPDLTTDQIVALLKSGLESYPANRTYPISLLIYMLDKLNQ